MDPADCKKIRDLESELLYHPSISSIHKKQSLKAVDHRKSAKMSKIQHRIFAVLLLCLLTVGVFSATLNNKLPPSPGASQEKQRFQELLDTIDPSALHEVLHENMKDKYQHGVFEKDKTAVEAIHQQNAEVAESLIELAKRQATGSSNGTVVTSTAVTTDTVVTSTDLVTSTPSSVPTTPVESQSTVAPTSQPPTSTPESSTPLSTLPESTVTEVSTSSAGTDTTSSVPASNSESTPVSTSPTPTSQASTSSSKAGSNSGTKTSPMTSKTTIYTTTLANGAAATVTSVTIVPAGQADQTTGGTSPSSTGSGGSLQTGGSSRMEVGLGAIMAAVGLVVMGTL